MARRILRGALALLALLVLVAGAGWAYAGWTLTRPVDVPAGALTQSLPVDSAAVARGEHLARAIVKCADCHGADLGGQYFIDQAPLARLYAPNLTPGRGSAVADYDDADWDRAVRHAVAPDRRPLLYMVASDFQYLSDADLAAVVGWLRQAPPVDRERQPSTVGPVGRALHLAGKIPLRQADLVPHEPTARPAPPVGATVEYGHYIAKVGGCIGCHGARLAGGPVPGAPPEWPMAANLTPTGLAAYDSAAFVVAMRDGRRPAGTEIRFPMPIAATRLMTDDETVAVWRYLRSLPPAEFGKNR